MEAEKNYFKKEIMNIDRVRNFVFKNFFEVNKEKILSSCIDGRYNKEDAHLAPRSIPGSDAGFLLLVSGALKELEGQGFNNSESLNLKIFEEILNLVGGAENFMIHTDNHNQNSVAAGCGHMKLAKNNPENYGVTNAQINLIFKFLENLKQKGIKEIVLEGDHKESAVLIVKDKKIGILHQDENNQAFVFHQALCEEFLEKLSKKLAEFEEFKSFGLDSFKIKGLFLKIEEKQLNVTLAKLAKGLPNYEINYENKFLNIKLVNF